MKTRLALSALFLLWMVIANAQSDAERRAEKTTANTDAGDILYVTVDSIALSLQMPAGAGYNGASVAYDPVRKYYYAAMAGNANFPMAVFSSNGAVITDTLSAKFDVRGLWYNKATAAIEANGYDNYGIISYKRDNRGIPVGIKTILGKCQPDVNSTGAYDPVHNEILFYDGTVIERHGRIDGQLKGDIEVEDDGLAYFNSTTVVYTGIPHKEIGLYDSDEEMIYLYDISTGKITEEITLPVDAPAVETLNFAYANGIFWLFDTGTREWLGYKMPK